MRLFKFGRELVLVGDVAYFRVVMTGKEEEQMFRNMVEIRKEIQRNMSRLAKETVGPEFEITNMTVGRGSVELLITLGATYVVISRYKNFIESLNLFRRQLETIIRDYGPFAEVNATWSPAPALAVAQAGSPSFESQSLTQVLLLAYLILSHAALLTVFIWLVVKR